ncbi:MAG: hypothetical protein Q9M36_12250 [Sulfurovum sp.]|nr:hypothetical protein [Sulfurovum sp.]
MYILIKILQSTVLLLASLTLHIIPWVPSWTIENIVNFTSIGLFIWVGYLFYLIIKKLSEIQKKPNIYKSAIVAALLFTYLGGVAILQIGISIGKSTHIKTYLFENEIFYTYKTLAGAIEVSRKDGVLPIRSVPLKTFTYKKVELVQKGLKIYALVEGRLQGIYTVKTQKP